MLEVLKQEVNKSRGMSYLVFDMKKLRIVGESDRFRKYYG